MSLETLLETGAALRVLTMAGYAAVLAALIAGRAARRTLLRRWCGVVLLASASLHTAYLVARWAAAGLVELDAQSGGGAVLSGAARLRLLGSHPPYAHRFDALQFVAWAVVVGSSIFAGRRLRRPGAAAPALALLLMIAAGRMATPALAPLAPALRGYWLFAHVALLFVSYALFAVGAACTLLRLFDARVRSPAIGALLGAASALLLLFARGGALVAAAALLLAAGATALSFAALRQRPPPFTLRAPGFVLLGLGGLALSAAVGLAAASIAAGAEVQGLGLLLPAWAATAAYVLTAAARAQLLSGQEALRASRARSLSA